MSCCIPRPCFFVADIVSLLMLLELFSPPFAFLFVLRLRSISGWLVLLITVLVAFLTACAGSY